MASERTAKRHDSLFGWVADLVSTSDDDILNLQSIDSYLYIRFLKMIVVLCFVGCCVTWPILFPVNATGGGNQTGLDKLSFSNIESPVRYFAHASVAWLYFGFVIYVITRETLFFINLRQAYLLSPWNASRISSRTLLFTSVPPNYLDAQRLRLLFPAYKQIWIATDPGEIKDKVKERDEIAMQLEDAEIALSKAANEKRMRAEKNNHGEDAEKTIAASLNSGMYRWLETGDRPTHRLKLFVGHFGKKVDTIDWARNQLAELVPEVESMQDTHINGTSKRLPAAFIEFEDLQTAAIAYSMVNHHQPAHMLPRQFGVQPDEVIWDNLHLEYWQLTIRYFVATFAVCLLILFWSIPVAFVGIVSNVNYLADNVSFLAWLSNVPPSIMGVITGLLPTILLALLMMLVPRILRSKFSATSPPTNANSGPEIAKKAGGVTKSEVEMQTQNWYFWFQIIQVFLLTTFTSGATSVASQIVNRPTSAVTLLAQNLPKASNFYIAYFILQGLAMSSRKLFNVWGLIKTAKGHFKSTSAPRQEYNRYMKLPSIKWGSVYPKFSTLACIALSYSCVAPLMLGFATIGMLILYFAFRYNILFVYEPKIDTKGAAYARALQHLTVGLYLAELCLIGLFAIGAGDSAVSVGPLAMMILLLVGTVLWHFSMRRALHPLTERLPQNLLIESAEEYDDFDSVAAAKNPSESTENILNPIHTIHEVPSQYERSRSHSRGDSSSRGPPPSSQNSSSMHRAPSHINDVFVHSPSSYNPNDYPKSWGSRILAFFQPSKYTVSNLSARLGPSLQAPVAPYPIDVAHEAYIHPIVKSRTPVLWIVKDEMGVSAREAQDSREAVPGLDVSDYGAKFDKKGKVVLDLGSGGLRDAPIWEGRIKY